ncbi:MAG: modification methylase [Methanomicrobiales archaeon HGW-Methanomicrobiales-4]|nr:MAG: modification methylase [Methanomicrobiales archaeon HGW-Methanomicrobiales-4]
MKTSHIIHFSDSADMVKIPDNSIDLIITSPPYPMIEMWDQFFSESDPKVRTALCNHEGYAAFQLMHARLNKTWSEVIRVLRTGGIACINIGDATREIHTEFSLFPNHSNIIQFFVSSGCLMLPTIIWRKQSNKPNKFMGSGMMPPNAYVTLEHEYILIFRKGSPRIFHISEKENRYRSSFFWEERNLWFSDIWTDIKGTQQNQAEKAGKEDIRKRTAAFPFEIPSRLISMFSIQGDTILDPFLGTGTTSLAALASGRNSIGYECDTKFYPVIQRQIMNCADFCIEHTEKRVLDHRRYMQHRTDEGNKGKYSSEPYGFEVITRQEIQIFLPVLQQITEEQRGVFEATYMSDPKKAKKTEYQSILF